MTKSLQDCQFDGLLLEAWERCTEDEALRASPAYHCVRQLLCELTPCSARGQDELARLERAVCALRNGVYEDLCRPSCSERDDDAAQTRGDKRTEQQQLSPYAAAECALKAALKAHGECTGLSRFFGEVATLTCDRGALLMRITDAVLSDFRTFADAVLGNRVAQIGTVLSREQLATRDRFFELARRSMNRARLAVTYVRDAMPAFDWNRYASEPGYMRLVVKPSPGCVMRTDDGDDVDGARGKGLLYQLNWLRSEIDRAEAENRCLYEQHTGLATELADVNREISRAQTDAAERTQQMSRELDDLRARSAGQVCAIDRLMETIQMLQGLRDANEGVDGACGKATEDASGPPKMAARCQP